MFISGGGFGCILSFFIMLMFIRKTKSTGEKWNEDTLKLMKERNEIAQQNLEFLKQKECKIQDILK